MTDLYDISLECSCNPYFKINNTEYMLRKATYNIIILSQNMEVVDTYNINTLSNLLITLKQRLKNSKIVIILAKPTENRTNPIYKKYLGIGGGNNFIHQYWCYIGIKINGSLKKLKFLCDKEKISETFNLQPKQSKSGKPRSSSASGPLGISYNTTKYFDHLYILNRHCQPDRLLHTNSIMDQLKLDYTIITADDNNNYSSENVSSKCTGQKRSLLKAIENAQENNYDHFVFMTDNITIHTDFVKYTAKLFNHDTNWKLVFLANSHRYGVGFREANKFRTPSWKAIGIRSSMYDSLSDLLQQPELNFVDILSDILSSNDNCYIPAEHLIVYRNSEAQRTNPKKYIISQLPKVNVIIDCSSGCHETSQLSINTALKQDYSNTAIFVVTTTAETHIYKRHLESVSVVSNMTDVKSHSSDYTVVVKGNCYIPYCFISRAVLLMEIDYMDHNVKYVPQLAVINGNNETNIMNRLRLEDRPLFNIKELLSDPEIYFIKNKCELSKTVNLPSLTLFQDVK